MSNGYLIIFFFENILIIWKVLMKIYMILGDWVWLSKRIFLALLVTPFSKHTPLGLGVRTSKEQGNYLQTLSSAARIQLQLYLHLEREELPVLWNSRRKNREMESHEDGWHGNCWISMAPNYGKISWKTSGWGYKMLANEKGLTTRSLPGRGDNKLTE